MVASTPSPDPEPTRDASSIESLERLIRTARDQIGPFEPPTTIGHYRIDGLLGSGGMGDVYVATDERLGRQVALKTLRTDQRWSPAAVQRFEREARLASRLDHPGICRIYEAGHSGGVPFIAMQLLPGQSLAAQIADRRTFAATLGKAMRAPVDETACRDTVALFEQLALALHAAHAVGLVHRDVKPSNIMLTNEVTPVLVDFGIARDYRDDHEQLTGSGGPPGTLPYMAPEQLTKRESVGPHTDVYSLGISLYEALTLDLPFQAATDYELPEQICRHPLPNPRQRNRHVDDDLRALLETATAKRPDQRYRSAAEMARDLSRWLRNEPLRARPVTTATRALRWVHRHRLLTAFVVAQTLAVAALAIAWQQAATVSKVDRLLAARGRLDDLAASLAELQPVTAGNIENVAELLRTYDSAIAPLRSLANAEINAGAGGGHAAASTFLQALTLHGGPNGAVEAARRDAAWARMVEDATVTQHATAWRRACDAARALTGVDFSPIPGLVPLGSDPTSGLPEFAFARSGTVPARDAGGELQLTDDFALVFVLIPGGTFQMGAQKGSPTAANYDPDAALDESPVRAMSARPFLLSKYEMTRSQWMQLSEGPDPSSYRIGTKGITPLFPVNDVSWLQCQSLFKRHGLVFPTEAQWEYAARAGSDTPYPWGRDPQCLAGHANTADKSAAPFVPFACDDFLDDRCPLYAGVGTYQPNAFGLCDVIGNVLELCDDEHAWYAPDEQDAAASVRTGDPIRVARGGDFTLRVVDQRVTARTTMRIDDRSNTLGVRPAMWLSSTHK